MIISRTRTSEKERERREKERRVEQREVEVAAEEESGGGAGERGGWRVAKGKVGPDSGGLGERRRDGGRGGGA